MPASHPRPHRWAPWAVGGAILSALAASACCWLPLLALAVGISSAGLAQKLAVWRPYFLGTAVVALGLAFWLTYRRPRKAAPTSGSTGTAEAGEACCAAPWWVHRLQNPMVLWPIAALVLAVALFPNAVDALLGSRPPTSRGTTPPVATVQEVRFRIEGMDCSMCAVGIRAGLQGLPGVVAAEVDYPSGKARVQARGVSLSEIRAQVQARVEAMGYRVVWGE